MRFKKPVALLFLGASLTIGLSACAEDKLTQEEFAESLGESSGDQEVADCIAAYVYDELGEDEASDTFGATEGDADTKELSEEGRQVLTDATESCVGGGEEATSEEEGAEEEGVDEIEEGGAEVEEEVQEEVEE